MTLYIVGAGGFGRETLDAALAADLEVAAFLDEYARQPHRGLSVLAVEQAAADAECVIGIADPAVRARLAALLTRRGLTPRTVLHPSAQIAPHTTVAPGCIVLAGVYVSSSCTLHEHVQINYNATVGHDATVGAYATVLPGSHLSGEVVVEEGATVGANACVLQGRRVGYGATVGAGAVVTHDVPDGETVIGVPARPLG